MLILIEPHTPCGVCGAEEVWAAGGKVYLCTIEPDPRTGEKYSTTALEARLKEIANEKTELGKTG